MPKSSFFLLLFLSTSILNSCVHGQSERGSRNGTSRQISLAQTQEFITTAMKVMRFLGEIMKIMMNFLTYLFQMMKQMTTATVDSLASYLSRSEGTSITRYKRSPPEEEYQNQNPSQGMSIGSLFSKAFMAPFKITFGLTRHIIYNATHLALEPIGILARSRIGRSIANTTRSIIDNATAMVWHYTKVSVLPRLDTLVTNMDEAEALPPGIMHYLKDLQSLYHIVHLLGFV